MQINLWSVLNSQKINKDSGSEVTEDFMRQLGSKGRFFMTEFSIEPTEKGWMLEVFSCSCMEDSIQILIPSDRFTPVKVIKDRIGNVEFHH